MSTGPFTIPSNVSIVPINLSSTWKTFTLPVVSTNPGRMIIFKDMYGNAVNSTLRLSTVGYDRIDFSNCSSCSLSNAYGAWTFLNDGVVNWYLTNAYVGGFTVTTQGSILQTNLPYVPSVYLIATLYSGSGTWLDSSPNGKNATLAAGTIAKNAKGNGIVLNGSTGWTFANLSLGNAWTLSVWFKSTGTYSGASDASIVTQQYTGGVFSPVFGFPGYHTVTGFNFYNGAWREGTVISLAATSWTYYTGTWDGTSLKTYINGALQGTTTPGGNSSDGGNPYNIGRTWYNGSPNSFVYGEIGEVRIYPAALTGAQVLVDYNYGAPYYAS